MCFIFISLSDDDDDDVVGIIASSVWMARCTDGHRPS